MKKEDIEEAEAAKDEETLDEIQGFIQQWEQDFINLNPDPE